MREKRPELKDDFERREIKMKTAIVLNSPEPVKNVAEEYVIYADAGYKHKAFLGDKKTLAVVGDFDTLGAAPDNEPIVGLEKEKDYTDGERAVHFAKECGAEEITIYGAFGGKPEHILGNIALLAIAEKIGLKAAIRGDNYTVCLVGGKRAFNVHSGASVSLIPYTDEAAVTDSRGLYYPLENLVLTKEDTRGISNVATADEFFINVYRGKVLAIIYD